MAHGEVPLTFMCKSQTLFGILHKGSREATRGVLVLVGGPQYRVGSHRQFVLLARYLADHDIPTLRFDYRGIGDSDEPRVSIWNTAPDIEAAINIFQYSCKELKEVIIWGLCDAATASILYAAQDTRVAGIVLVNPWIRTKHLHAKAMLIHYYLPRLFDSEWWLKLIRGQWRIGRSVKDILTEVRTTITLSKSCFSQANEPKLTGPKEYDDFPDAEELARLISDFLGKILIILSGDDMVAHEFKGMVSASRSWRRVVAAARVTRHELPEANHTFTSNSWRRQVGDWTVSWIKSW